MALPQAIQGLQKTDPRLYEALVEIYRNVEKINDTLFPIISQAVNEALDVPVAAPTNFLYVILPRAVSFDWDDMPNASGYEIRLGSSWDTATFVLRTISSEAAINPLLVGTYNYLIKTFNRAGSYSPDTSSVSVTINPLGQVTISAEVIDNNVLLRWTNAVTQFQLSHYRITKNEAEAGRVTGTFATIFENTAGEYEYCVSAVDIAGNEALQATFVVQVAQPPDFELESILTANLANAPNSQSNTALCSHDGIDKRVVCVDTAQTWDEHFEDNSWDNIQEQIDAGYPLYAEPALTSGHLEYIFDFGSVFNNVIIGTDFIEDALDGDINVTCQISSSTDGSSYTSPAAGFTLYATSMRYAKVRLIFTPDDDKSLSYIYQFRCFINVKREVDGGVKDVLAADSGGTTVNFNKSFKDIESITVSPLATAEQSAIYDFTDIPYPSSFKILLYDAGGSRINGTVSWKARGIV